MSSPYHVDRELFPGSPRLPHAPLWSVSAPVPIPGNHWCVDWCHGVSFLERLMDGITQCGASGAWLLSLSTMHSWFGHVGHKSCLFLIAEWYSAVWIYSLSMHQLGDNSGCFQFLVIKNKAEWIFMDSCVCVGRKISLLLDRQVRAGAMAAMVSEIQLHKKLPSPVSEWPYLLAAMCEATIAAHSPFSFIFLKAIWLG